MSRDPSRRPSKDRIRVAGDANAIVWVECTYCLGDGWHYPGSFLMPDRSRPTHKQRCYLCDGLGARQIAALLRGPHAKIVPAPKGWSVGPHTESGK